MPQPRAWKVASLVLPAAVALALGACVGRNDRPAVAAPPPPPDPTLQTVELTANKINIRQGERIGGQCLGGAVIWEAGAINERSREFVEWFREAAVAAGVPTARSSTSAFSARGDAKRPIYEVGSVVSQMTLNYCSLRHPGNAYVPDQITYNGDANVAVDWEILSTLEERVIHRERTTGWFKTRGYDATSPINYVGFAYKEAALALVRSPKFREAITRVPAAPAGAAVSSVAGELWSLPALAPLQGPLAQNIDHVRRAAVTVDFGGGHGSGFFLTQDGWIMTNAHVARGSRTVKIILADGKPMFGQVGRVHEARDVALIKVEGDGYPALPLRTQPVALTEEVYAIGTPLDKKLSGTVTRGIVSQFRTNPRNLTDIQADVTVQPGSSGGPLLDAAGNVVGVSYSGLSAGGKGTGLNFFIPIQDALAKLNLQLGGV